MSTRSGTETRQRTEQVSVRLTPAEMATVTALADECGVSLPDMLRRALDIDRTAALLYTMNGYALYGRDLGAWDDPTSRIGRNEAERDRWLRQARYLTSEVSP